MSRKLVFQGVVQEVQEKNMKWLENFVKDTGEPLDEALERLIIEHRYNKNEQQLEQQHPPSTLDYYLCTPTHICKRT